MKGTMVVIDTNGVTTETEHDTPPGLSKLQEAVGGYIELVPMFTQYNGHECVVFCNEEGKLEGLPLNMTATKLWHEQLGMRTDVLVGDVAILYGDEAFMRKI